MGPKASFEFPAIEGAKKSKYLEKERHDHGKTGVWKPRVVPQTNPKKHGT